MRACSFHVLGPSQMRGPDPLCLANLALVQRAIRHVCQTLHCGLVMTTCRHSIVTIGPCCSKALLHSPLALALYRVGVLKPIKKHVVWPEHVIQP